MTDTKQPEALRLADELLFAGRFAYETEDGAARRRIARNFKAATELRRLHEVNAELLKSALLFQDYMKFMDAGDDVKAMLAFAELVEVNAAAIAKAEVTK
jgi:hypothetical protein